MNYPAFSRDGKTCAICGHDVTHDANGRTVHKNRRGGSNSGKDCLKHATAAAQRRMAS